jgi:hypothetical protein
MDEPSASLADDQAGILQDREVLGNRGLGYPETLGDLPCRQFSGGQVGENLAPHGRGEGFEYVIEGHQLHLNFHGREALADSVNHLLLVGFYLVNIGFVCLALRFGDKPSDLVGAVEYLSTKIGLVIVLLGFMHFFRGLDIDEGMVLKVDGALYYGADAIHALAAMGSAAGAFNRVNRWLFASQSRAQLLYPLLRSVRNLLLKALRRTRINNLHLPDRCRF